MQFIHKATKWAILFKYCIYLATSLIVLLKYHIYLDCIFILGHREFFHNIFFIVTEYQLEFFT